MLLKNPNELKLTNWLFSMHSWSENMSQKHLQSFFQFSQILKGVLFNKWVTLKMVGLRLIFNKTIMNLDF